MVTSTLGLMMDMAGFIESAVMGERVEVICVSEEDLDDAMRDTMLMCNDIGLAVEVSTETRSIVVGDDLDDGGFEFRPMRIELLRGTFCAF